MIGDGENMTMGVVGLGLMGSSIAANFLIAGHKVVGLEPVASEFAAASGRMEEHYQSCQSLNLGNKDRRTLARNLSITQDFADLQNCDLVLESVVEDFDIKVRIINQIENQVSRQCIIGSNTSAIPITSLQKKLRHPERFMGLHWSAPAYASRYLEIICGSDTDVALAEAVHRLGAGWGKEPILVRKDIRGFVTNRLMYAIYREGLHLLEQGATDLASLDKAFKYDTGSWITVMGIFQRMDYLGIKHFAALAESTFDLLDNSKKVPHIMSKLVTERGRGIHNLNGLYPYTAKEAQAWKEAFDQFSSEMYRLLSKQEENPQPLNKSV